MNTIIDLFNDHKSERSFIDRAIDDATLERIISTAYRAPTSVHSQQVSVIVTRDAEKRAQISQIAGGQPWIAKAPVFITFVLDMYKTEVGMKLAGKEQVAHQSIESLVAGATDVGIALGSVMAAARSEGLGIVPIGGIRLRPQELIELLELPEHTFPVAGVVIGHVDVPSHHKPRLPLETFRHDEAYITDGLEAKITRYNQQMTEHWQAINRTDGDTWSESVSGYYQHIYFPDVLPALIKQGFGVDK
ncbi:nitroreductase family protein [Leclercia adecarboxylata]|uniref:Nitroreductase family protein n=1 Tax=Leclercia adecarboxylata TaxID=83655 RepID=A0A9X4BCQ1_9ENTR|nr:nitroreductase family protein [Leclercia adecarboxylata]MBD1404972.1 nitroreductase family protein [Leclercia adecarboxylata]MDC6622404.1 nitroreductase family protein [Leclercia adecarboxylata]MDC6633476.1 nitroreductase family protein [Leclercia adecarboxylata]MDC6638587.1 nitroreductase family protein [Leclercia adecarboxylata]MDC6649096.1 nitroreductase family protein [Leclercia adecarboxylata]